MQPEIALVRAGSRRGGPDGRRGWNMIENWEDAAFETDGRVTTFRTEHLEITFTGTGIEGGCPAERDNDGCYVCEDGGATLAPSKVFFCGVYAAAKNGWDLFRTVRGANSVRPIKNQRRRRLRCFCIL